MNVLLKNPAVLGGVVIGGVVLLWILTRGTQGIGKDIGSAAGGLASGLVQGAGDMTSQVLSNGITLAPKTIGETAGAVSDWSLSDANPLKDFGEWLGGAAFELTRSKENGGVW